MHQDQVSIMLSQPQVLPAVIVVTWIQEIAGDTEGMLLFVLECFLLHLYNRVATGQEMVREKNSSRSWKSQ